MSQRSFYITLAVLVCSLVFVFATAFYFHRAEANICNAGSTCADKAEQVNGDMLWESLSHQFVSSVQF